MTATRIREPPARRPGVSGSWSINAPRVTATTGFGEPIQSFFNFADGERIVGITCSDERLLPVPATEDLELLEEDDPQPPFAVAVTRLGKTVRFPIAAHSEVSNRSGRRFASLGFS